MVIAAHESFNGSGVGTHAVKGLLLKSRQQFQSSSGTHCVSLSPAKGQYPLRLLGHCSKVWCVHLACRNLVLLRFGWLAIGLELLEPIVDFDR